MEHGEGIPGPHAGGNATFFLSGSRGRKPFATGSDSRAANGGLGCARMPRLSMRSLWIPKAARTDQFPLPVGSQAHSGLQQQLGVVLIAAGPADARIGLDNEVGIIAVVRTSARHF